MTRFSTLTLLAYATGAVAAVRAANPTTGPTVSELNVDLLVAAGSKFNVRMVQLLLHHGRCDPTAVDKLGRSALHHLTSLPISGWFAHAQNAALGVAPVDSSGDPSTPEGYSELWAGIIRRAQARGSDDDDGAGQDTTYGDFAAEVDALLAPVAALLLDAGAHADAADRLGATPLHGAADSGLPRTMRALLRRAAFTAVEGDSGCAGPPPPCSDEGL